MPERDNVQNTHISEQLRVLHGALLDIVAVMNRPQRDEALIKEAGIALDRALFPLLVGDERFGERQADDAFGQVGFDVDELVVDKYQLGGGRGEAGGACD